MKFFEALSSTWQFFQGGGVFMFLLALCSFAAVTVIVLKITTLTRKQVLPTELEVEVEKFEEHLEAGNLSDLQEEFARGENSLARLCAVALRNAGRTQGEVKEAVQSSAREEVVRMNSGLPVLEVVITIAPLLGLLGTASGLVTVFADLESDAKIQKGIATALSTTIVGLAVAIPSVIAQSVFSRKIETFSARLEVLLGRLVSAYHQHVFFRDHK